MVRRPSGLNHPLFFTVAHQSGSSEMTTICQVPYVLMWFAHWDTAARHLAWVCCQRKMPATWTCSVTCPDCLAETLKPVSHWVWTFYRVVLLHIGHSRRFSMSYVFPPAGNAAFGFVNAGSFAMSAGGRGRLICITIPMLDVFGHNLQCQWKGGKQYACKHVRVWSS